VQLRSGSADSKLQESLSSRLAVHDAEAGGLGGDERRGAQIGPRAVRVTVARRLGSASLSFRLASAVTAQTVRIPVSAGQAVICGSWMESAWYRRQARLPVQSQPHQGHPARSAGLGWCGGDQGYSTYIVNSGEHPASLF